jgi:hypothetical protein
MAIRVEILATETETLRCCRFSVSVASHACHDQGLSRFVSQRWWPVCLTERCNSYKTRYALAAGADGLVVQGVEAGGQLMADRPLAITLPEVFEAADGAPVSWLPAGWPRPPTCAGFSPPGPAAPICARYEYMPEAGHRCRKHPRIP